LVDLEGLNSNTLWKSVIKLSDKLQELGFESLGTIE
jgi:hypothetical protein